MYGYFKWQTGEIAYEKTLTCLRKGNLKKATESLLIAAQNNAIRTNCIKAKIENKQEDSKRRLSGEKEETINPSQRIQQTCTK